MWPEQEGPEQRNDSTAILVVLARSGQQDALDGIYARIAPALCAWAHHRMGAKTRRACEPEDIVQEVWRRALTSLSKHDPARGTFRSWIFSIAKHVLLETLRQAARLARAREAEGSSVFRWSQISDNISTVAQQAARNDTVRQFIALVDELPPEDAELLVRCGLEGAFPSEAGKRLGLTAEAAAKRWQRLQERVRKNSRFAKLMDDGG